MPRPKNPDKITAEDEIRAVLAWANRAGFESVAATLNSALAKMPKTAGSTRPRRRRS